MSIKLLKPSTVAKRLKTIGNDSAETTLSAAYYATVQGNVSTLKNAAKNVNEYLHPVYRQFISAKFNKETGVWEYNRTKASKLLEDLKCDFKVTSFDDFVLAVDNLLAEKAAEVAQKEAEVNAMSEKEKAEQAKKQVVAYLGKKFAGLSPESAYDIFVAAMKEAKVKTDGFSLTATATETRSKQAT